MQTQLNESDRLIPVSELCEKLGCEPITLQRACARHDVPLTVLSRSKRGLMAADYQLLLTRARCPQTEAES